MKKITFLLGLLLSLIGVSAQAQDLIISDAPTDGSFAANTQWYLIKASRTNEYHKAGYLSNASAYVDATAGFRLDNTEVPSTDEGLWCLVADGDDGYTIYNKEVGTTKVLGIGSTGAFYDAGTTTSGVTTKFTFASSTNSDFPYGICVGLYGSSNYWNNGNWTDGDNKYACKLATWTGLNDGGNAFYFIPVSSSSNASAEAEAFFAKIEAYQSTAYKTFLALAKINSDFIGEACATEINTFNNTPTTANALTLAKAALKAYSGKYFRFQNGRDTYNVLYAKEGYAKITNEENINTDAADLWAFEANEDGTFKLYNPNTKKYMGALSTSYNAGDLSTAMTDESGAINFNLSIHDDTYWIIADVNGNKINGEDDTKGYRVNNWSTIDGYSNIWKLTEAKTLNVPLSTISGVGSYASVYLPVSVSGVSGATAWLGALDSDNSVLKMTETTGVPAEKGFVLVGNSDNTDNKATLTLGESKNTDNNNSLTGTLEAITLSTDTRSNYLVFGVNSNTVGFYTPAETVTTIPANKAYIDATKLSSGSAIAMQFGGETTGISQAATSAANAAAPVFDLSGRRVANPAKGGIYIQSGKKFVK